MSDHFRLVIVCSTGADYGSLHAPLCVYVCDDDDDDDGLWVEGERHRDRRADRQTEGEL